jgi:hypothetical protein
VDRRRVAQADCGELLDDEHRHAGAGDVGDDLVELGDDERGQAHRQLVDEEHGRVGAEAAGQGQHLLLAARQGAGQLPAPLPQAGEQREGHLADPLQRGAARRRHAQVVVDAEVREHRTALADVAHADAGQLVGGGAVEVAALHVAAAAPRGQQAAEDVERGGLAGAVRPEQGGDGAPLDGEVDAVEDLDAPVAGPDVVQRHRRRPCRRRRGRRRVGHRGRRRRRQHRNPWSGASRRHAPPSTIMAITQPLLRLAPSSIGP